MKASDIVLQMASKLPLYTDLFTDNFDIDSVSTVVIGDDLEVTLTTSEPHNFNPGQGIVTTGALTPLSVSSFTRNGTLGIIETVTDHDFTYSQSAGAISGSGDKNAIVSGADEPEFNGSFLIAGVPDKRTLQVIMQNSGPLTATGEIIVENASSVLQSYNGLHSIIAVPTDTTLTYLLRNSSDLLPPIGDIAIRGNARISSAVSVEAISAAYTSQEIDKLWAFVVLDDVVASKNRKILSDATDNLQRANEYRQQIIQPATVYVVFPTAAREIAGAQSRDVAEEIFKPICQSILFKRFDSQLSIGEYNPMQFLSHGVGTYNSSFYVHSYNFQQVADISFGDTVGYDDDVAFRGIDLTIGTDLGVAQVTASIELG